MEPWKLLANQSLRAEAVRADYIHEDRYASLGLAVLHRCPLAFLSRADREAVCGVSEGESLLKHLPDAIRLEEVFHG